MRLTSWIILVVALGLLGLGPFWDARLSRPSPSSLPHGW